MGFGQGYVVSAKTDLPVTQSWDKNNKCSLNSCSAPGMVSANAGASTNAGETNLG